MVFERLGRGNGRIFVSIVFIPAGQETVVASGAPIQINEQSIVLHHIPPDKPDYSEKGSGLKP
jgi:hypothetical protein